MIQVNSLPQIQTSSSNHALAAQWGKEQVSLIEKVQSYVMGVYYYFCATVRSIFGGHQTPPTSLLFSKLEHDFTVAGYNEREGTWARRLYRIQCGDAEKTFVVTPDDFDVKKGSDVTKTIRKDQDGKETTLLSGTPIFFKKVADWIDSLDPKDRYAFKECKIDACVIPSTLARNVWAFSYTTNAMGNRTSFALKGYIQRPFSSDERYLECFKRNKAN